MTFQTLTYSIHSSHTCASNPHDHCTQHNNYSYQEHTLRQLLPFHVIPFSHITQITLLTYRRLTDAVVIFRRHRLWGQISQDSTLYISVAIFTDQSIKKFGWRWALIDNVDDVQALHVLHLVVTMIRFAQALVFLRFVVTVIRFGTRGVPSVSRSSGLFVPGGGVVISRSNSFIASCIADSRFRFNLRPLFELLKYLEIYHHNCITMDYEVNISLVLNFSQDFSVRWYLRLFQECRALICMHCGDPLNIDFYVRGSETFSAIIWICKLI